MVGHEAVGKELYFLRQVDFTYRSDLYVQAVGVAEVAFEEIEEGFIVLIVSKNSSFFYSAIEEVIVAVFDVGFDSVFDRHMMKRTGPTWLISLS